MYGLVWICSHFIFTTAIRSFGATNQVMEIKSRPMGLIATHNPVIENLVRTRFFLQEVLTKVIIPIEAKVLGVALKQDSNQISIQTLLNSMVGDLNYGEQKISLSTVKVSPLTADWVLTESRVTGGGVINLAVTATEISGQFIETDANKVALDTDGRKYKMQKGIRKENVKR